MKISPARVVLKAILLFLLFDIAVAAIPPGEGCRISIYNHLVPGRERLPFGENPDVSYNLSLFDLDAMFAAHEIDSPKPPSEFRVILLGDSSIWGTLLRPEETLAARLNALNLRAPDGRALRFYNVGYPTISLTKDLLLLQEARRYSPDLILWFVTLEAFPNDKQYTPPLVSHNAARLRALSETCALEYDENDPALVHPDFWARTFLGRRRAWADWYRLQMYGILWGITGVDQMYPETYEAAKTDFDADPSFHDLQPGDSLRDSLAWDALRAGFCLADDTPMWLINEPILISDGENSDIRYDYFYPRWAYDSYRQRLAETSTQNGWVYADFWNLVPMDEFTNSAVHLTPKGETLLADAVKDFLFEHIGER